VGRKRALALGFALWAAAELTAAAEPADAEPDAGDLLDQFLVRIDYPRERLWLRRAPAARADATEQAPEPP
jgi:hypothetical protein